MLMYTSRSILALGAVLLGLLSSSGCGSTNWIAKADESFRNKAYQDASINFRKAIQKNPNNGEAFYGLGRSEIELSHFAEALDAFREAARLLPDRMDVKAKYADLVLAFYQADPQNQGQYALLKSLTAEFLAKDPNSFDGLRLKGTIAYLDRKPAEAIESFKRANAIRPMQEYLIVAYMEALLQLGEGDAAEELGHRLIAAKKTFAPVYDILYREAMRKERTAAAEAILREKVQNNPMDTAPSVQLASHYLQNGNRQAALAAIKSLTESNPPVPKAHLVAGDFYFKLQELDQALFHYEQGAKAEPALTSDATKRIATMRAAQNRVDEAIKLVDDVIAKSPQDQEAKLMKANLWVNRGDPEEVNRAVLLLQEVLKAQPKDSGVMQALGRAYIAKGDYSMARSVLQETLRNSTTAEESKVLLASVDILDKKSQNAMQSLDELIGRSPDNARARLLKLAALMELQRYDDARTVLDKLVQDLPDSENLRLQQGILAILSRRYADAEAVFTKLSVNHSDIRVISGLTETFIARRQFERAIQVLEGEIGKSKDPDSVRLILAKTATLAGNHDRAIAELQKVSASHPGNADVLTTLGDSYREKGMYLQAIESFKKAAALAPKDPKNNLLLGMAYYQSGKPDEAIGAYRAALQAEPNNSIVMNNLAYSLAEAGGAKQLEEAQTLAERAVQLRPKAADNRDTLGYVLLKRGMVDGSVQVFDALVRRFPKNASYQHHLGLALLAKKDNDGARKAFQAALGKSASPAEAEEIKRAISGMKR